MSPRQMQWETKFERYLVRKFEDEIAQKDREEQEPRVKEDFDLYTKLPDSPSVRARRLRERINETGVSGSFAVGPAGEVSHFDFRTAAEDGEGAVSHQTQEALRKVFESLPGGVEGAVDLTEFVDRGREATDGAEELLERIRKENKGPKIDFETISYYFYSGARGRRSLDGQRPSSPQTVRTVRTKAYSVGR